jgi:hypothetical protein
MEMNKEELDQYEFEKMLENTRNHRRNDGNPPSLRVHRIVEALRGQLYHESLDFLGCTIEEILACYEIDEIPRDAERDMLRAELFRIAEGKEFAEIAHQTEMRIEKDYAPLTASTG